MFFLLNGMIWGTSKWSMMKPTVSDFLSMLSPGLAQKVTGLFSVVPYPICGSHKQHVVSRETDGGWAGARDRESMDSPGEQGKKKVCGYLRQTTWCSVNSANGKMLITAKLIWWLNFSPSTNNFSSKLYLLKVSVFLFWETFYFPSVLHNTAEGNKALLPSLYLFNRVTFIQILYSAFRVEVIKISDRNKKTRGGKRQIKHTVVLKGANTISGRETLGQIEPASSPGKIREETIFPIKCQIC